MTKILKYLIIHILCLFPSVFFAQNEFKIAFGSCSNQRLPQVLWPSIIANQPDLWIWMGDIIYMDTDNVLQTQEAYQIQKYNEAYQVLIHNTEIIGIWDDHDYGLNDGGKNWPVKYKKKELMFEFLDEPENSKRRLHEGVYGSYNYGLNDNKQIKIIMLYGR